MKSSSTLVLAVAIATLATVSMARPEFRERVPNALNVKGVDAIGHVNKEGGGSRNAFGKDFDAAGRKWTTELCQQDSDGDGQTNGEELGDPCCQWVQTSNAKVLWTEGVSAPGDATSKSDPTLWAKVSCSSTPTTTTPSSPSSPSSTSSPAATTEAPKAGGGNAGVAPSVSAAAAVATVVVAALGM